MQLASCLTWSVQRVRQFGRDDAGNISIFALTLVVAMIGIGGLALDTMRFEQQRVLVQNTLDRCTLMAASLKQRLSPSDVVYDCMESAGLRSTVKSVSVTDSAAGNGTLSRRTVDAVAETDINTLFPNAIGIRTMNVDARSIASQKLSRIEISLVLDVSSSMEGTKLTNLKNAAKEFVSTVLSNDPDRRISINLVPYSSQVNLGATLRGLYNATFIHGAANVNCFDMPASVYTALPLSRTVAMPMTGNVDAFSTTFATGNQYVSPTDANWALPRTFSMPLTANMARGDNRSCPALPSNVVRVGQQNITTLHTAIDGLIAAGMTSTHAGLRWGTALLDPGSQSVFSSLISANAVPSNLAGRPFAYNEPDVMKIVVVMTDGQNSGEDRLNDGFRTGLSPIYRASDGFYSIFHAAQTSANKFYVPHSNRWVSSAYMPTGGTVVQQTWPQVWAAMRLSYVAYQFYTRAFPTDTAYSWINTMNMMKTSTPAATADTQQQSLCNLAKAQNVIIYSIAFEAPVQGRTALAACASSPAHYFDATGTQISSAFRMIATNITQLRLTQ